MFPKVNWKRVGPLWWIEGEYYTMCNSTAAAKKYLNWPIHVNWTLKSFLSYHSINVIALIALSYSFLCFYVDKNLYDRIIYHRKSEWGIYFLEPVASSASQLWHMTWNYIKY